jgi:hypothetical protein
LNENTRLKVADKKSEAQLRAREKAQSALKKFEFDSGSMNDKDWGDMMRWVLPQSKVDFLLKDLKKRKIFLPSSQLFQAIGSPTYLARRLFLPPEQQQQQRQQQSSINNQMNA